MLRRIADWCRDVVRSPEFKRAFCARHIGAAATSAYIHVMAILAVVWLSSHAVKHGVVPGQTTTIAAETEPVDIVGRVITKVVPPDPDAPTPKKQPPAPVDDTGPSDLGIRMEPGGASLSFEGFSIDVEKLTSRARQLFPFLTRRLEFSVFAKQKRRNATSLVNPYAAAPLEKETGPLEMSDEELQQVIDRAWSRRERWTPFQGVRVLAESYSADDGQVPRLLRGYANQNMLQPYVESRIRDPRVWSQLALTADHNRFIDFVFQYAAEHPGTKATVELQFLLDMLAEASLDTLIALLELEPGRDLKWTRRTNPQAFDALVTIQRFYGMERERRGLSSYRSLTRHYDQVRLSILTSILRTTPDGYRANDARYLIGQIYWRQDRRADARRIWQEMQVVRDDTYVTTYSGIIAALRDGDEQRRHAAATAATEAPAADAANNTAAVVRLAESRRKADEQTSNLEGRIINSLLEGERTRWLDFSRERLKKFGYRVDTF